MRFKSNRFIEIPRCLSSWFDSLLVLYCYLQKLWHGLDRNLTVAQNTLFIYVQMNFLFIIRLSCPLSTMPSNWHYKHANNHGTLEGNHTWHKHLQMTATADISCSAKTKAPPHDNISSDKLLVCQSSSEFFRSTSHFFTGVNVCVRISLYLLLICSKYNIQYTNNLNLGLTML